MSKNSRAFKLLFKDTWTQPSSLIKEHVIRHNKDLPDLLILIAITSGCLSAYIESRSGIVIIAVFGLLLGFLSFKFFFPYLYLGIGKLWSGKASLEDIRLAFCLSLFPEVLGIIVKVFALLLGVTEFQSSLSVSGLTINIISLILLVIYLKEVQKFEWYKAVLTVFLPLLFLVPIFLIYFFSYFYY